MSRLWVDLRQFLLNCFLNFYDGDQSFLRIWQLQLLNFILVTFQQCQDRWLIQIVDIELFWCFFLPTRDYGRGLRGLPLIVRIRCLFLCVIGPCVLHKLSHESRLLILKNCNICLLEAHVHSAEECLAFFPHLRIRMLQCFVDVHGVGLVEL